MSGPFAAPATVGRVPQVEASAAEGLAWYAADEGFGVLAPRGWHCADVYGSSGAELFVTPEAHAPEDFFDMGLRLRGPVVVLSMTNGGTSGRFEVARMIPLLFPAYRAWAVETRKDEDPGASELRPDMTPYADRVRRSATMVEFRIRASGVGRGSAWRMTPNGEDFAGAAVLSPKPDMDVLKVMVRLPPGLQGLAPAILRTFEAEATRP